MRRDLHRYLGTGVDNKSELVLPAEIELYTLPVSRACGSCGGHAG